MSDERVELDPQLSKQYLQRHDLPQIINNLVLDIAKQQPVDPFQYMITCLEKAHAQKQSHAQESIDHQRNRPGNQSSPEAPIRDIPVYNAPTEGVLLTTGSGSEGSASEPPCAPRRFCMADVATHCTRDDCWIVVAGKVYDVTDWLPDHPGGDGMILQLAGHDASLEFAKFHSSYACELLPHYYKGELDATLQPPPRPPRSINASPAHLGGGMLTNQYRGFPLVEVRPQSSNVRVFRFATLAPDEALSLPLVSSVTVCVRDADGGEHEQSYCPIASGKGWFDVLVKRYPADVVSGAIHKLCIGAKLECKGPSPSPVQFDLDQYAELGLLAAGAGVAPMLQIIDALMKAPKCLLQVTLLAWHQTEEDILYKHLLDFYAKKKPNQLVVQYLLTKPRNSNYEHKGYVSSEHLTNLLPSPVPGMHVVVSGPERFNMQCTAMLQDVGFTSEQWTVL